jgi:hypothetical protein
MPPWQQNLKRTQYKTGNLKRDLEESQSKGVNIATMGIKASGIVEKNLSAWGEYEKGVEMAKGIHGDDLQIPEKTGFLDKLKYSGFGKAIGWGAPDTGITAGDELAGYEYSPERLRIMGKYSDVPELMPKGFTSGIFKEDKEAQAKFAEGVSSKYVEPGADEDWEQDWGYQMAPGYEQFEKEGGGWRDVDQAKSVEFEDGIGYETGMGEDEYYAAVREMHGGKLHPSEYAKKEEEFFFNQPDTRRARLGGIDEGEFKEFPQEYGGGPAGDPADILGRSEAQVQKDYEQYLQRAEEHTRDIGPVITGETYAAASEEAGFPINTWEQYQQYIEADPGKTQAGEDLPITGKRFSREYSDDPAINVYGEGFETKYTGPDTPYNKLGLTGKGGRLGAGATNADRIKQLKDSGLLGGGEKLMPGFEGVELNLSNEVKTVLGFTPEGKTDKPKKEKMYGDFRKGLQKYNTRMGNIKYGGSPYDVEW